MPIESQKDAEKYFNDVVDKLKYLAKLSTEAGMFSHASVWHTILAAWLHPDNEFDTIIDMMGMYIQNPNVYERYLKFPK